MQYRFEGFFFRRLDKNAVCYDLDYVGSIFVYKISIMASTVQSSSMSEGSLGVFVYGAHAHSRFGHKGIVTFSCAGLWMDFKILEMSFIFPFSCTADLQL